MNKAPTPPLPLLLLLSVLLLLIPTPAFTQLLDFRNEWKGEKLVQVTDRVLTSRQDSPYTDALSLKPLPTPPVAKLRLLLSVMLSKSDLNTIINAAIIDCLAASSTVDRQNWGAYSADRFTQDVVQIEYYALIPETAGQTFPSVVDTYIRDGRLTSCVRTRQVGVGANAELFSGRAVIAPAAQVPVSDASTPAWVIGVVLGVLVLLALIWVVVLAVKGEPAYSEKDYVTWEREMLDQLELLESSHPGTPPEKLAIRRLDRQLRQIAGQRPDAIVTVPNSP